MRPGHWYAGQSSRRQTSPEGVRKSVRMSAMSDPQWRGFVSVIAGRLLGYNIRNEKTFLLRLVVAQPSGFLFWREPYEKETSSKQRPQMSVLRQSFDSEKCGRHLPAQ